MEMKAIAIVPAAGMGKRFDPFMRKTFAEIKGLPLIIQTLKRLHQSECIEEIIPVLRSEDVEKGYEMAVSHGLNKIKKVVAGGRERQDSVYNGLSSIKEDCIVLIHDGARPIIPNGLIERLVRELDGFDGVVPGIPLRETIKIVDEGVIVNTVRRERLWSIQTPQAFPIDTLKKAYQNAYNEGYQATDDSALVERIGGKVRIIMGSPFNIKVTTPEDLELVKCLIKAEKLEVKNKN
jgi:2-C-methyl-D-erythritol 4-phosphate cytidylyltransferase